MAHGPLIDPGAVFTEVVKYLATGAVGLIIGNGWKWLQGFRKTSEAVTRLEEAVKELQDSLTSQNSETRRHVDERIDTMQQELRGELNTIRTDLQKNHDDTHRFKGQVQHGFTAQAVQIARLEEQVRMVALLTLGPERMRELEVISTPKPTVVIPEEPE